MLRRLLVLLVAGALAACGGGGDSRPSATLDTTPTTARTTTTKSVEAEVEAAYLKSWDVLAAAALKADAAGLDDSYSGKALEYVNADIRDIQDRGALGRFAVDHDYSIHVDPTGALAQVVDNYTNHSVLLDATTRQPIEPDPNKLVSETYWLRLIDGIWKVVDIVRS